ncbi:hypothetical protein P170DRAFT_437882 [Aspergillus steynii IBT 23096]|uniref:Uncharacterized protein n=1 Tax=Aspergillus steynii IBT 23096 TaxID=1392250 RepID=A0A2I2G5Q0_9EURO|nr:uncharacterized protein P170DRAFT_437882 [Aspergillus steynii IBT 23096]PLB48200.1 hypothetical protein P170DRAFT_437882 [Aspergillus steynii IBT 23096]
MTRNIHHAGRNPVIKGRIFVCIVNHFKYRHKSRLNTINHNNLGQFPGQGGAGLGGSSEMPVVCPVVFPVVLRPLDMVIHAR